MTNWTILFYSSLNLTVLGHVTTHYFCYLELESLTPRVILFPRSYTNVFERDLLTYQGRGTKSTINPSAALMFVFSYLSVQTLPTRICFLLNICLHSNPSSKGHFPGPQKGQLLGNACSTEVTRSSTTGTACNLQIKYNDWPSLLHFWKKQEKAIQAKTFIYMALKM